MAAEWEPAIGVLISWPLVIPEKLVTDLAKIEKLFIVLETESERGDAQKKFEQLKIAPEKVTYIVGDPEQQSAVVDGVDDLPEQMSEEEVDFMRRIYIWTRDWGPFAGFAADGKYHLIDPQFKDYALSGLDCGSKLQYFPGARTTEWNGDEVRSLGKALNANVNVASAYLTGGNVMFDGIGTAMSTCCTINENQHFGIDKETFNKEIEQKFGIKKYHIIPNFEVLGIQHIDCLLKFLSEDTILVARPPADSKIYERYQEIVAQLSQLTNCHGQPYKIFRIDAGIVSNRNFGMETEGIAAYTNSLILNKRIFVPLYGIETDATALETWRSVMPGYEVTGYEFTRKSGSKIPWQSFDALHCRTRAIWDPGMLHMSRLPVSLNNDGAVTKFAVNIVDYSQEGLIEDDLLFFWRPVGSGQWNQLPLKRQQSQTQFFANIERQMQGTILEYYFAAADHSGRQETLPRTAPANFFRVVFK